MGNTTLLVMFLACICIHQVRGDNTTALHVGMLMALSDFPYANAGILLANMFVRSVEEICNETDILEEYMLKIHVRDTKVLRLISYC